MFFLCAYVVVRKPEAHFPLAMQTSHCRLFVYVKGTERKLIVKTTDKRKVKKVEGGRATEHIAKFCQDE